MCASRTKRLKATPSATSFSALVHPINTFMIVRDRETSGCRVLGSGDLCICASRKEKNGIVSISG